MRRVVVIVLAVVALAPAGVEAAAWYRCLHDGVLRAACCCPASARHHDEVPGNALRARCCCEITTFEARASSERGAPPAAHHAAPALAVAAAPVVVRAEAPRRVVALYARAPRGPPGPLFARHCALLL